MTPLVFVFLGQKWPHYGSASLRIAAETTPNPLVVLAEVPRPPNVPSVVEWQQVGDFYSASEFDGFALAEPYSADFREGFWLKTAERLFVIRAYMRFSGCKTIFHGELDCLFFSLPKLESEIARTELTGVFLPRETQDRCIGSIIFVNEQASLDALCEFLVKNSALGNEMDILGALPHGQESKFYALPTAEALFRGSEHAPPDTWPVVPPRSTLIVDGAVIGRWLFGVDPRNTGGRGVKNRLQSHKYGVLFDLPLSEVSITIERRGGWSLLVEGPNGRRFQVATIHVHSKIHAKITARYLARVVGRIKRGKATVIIPIEFQFILATCGKIFRQVVSTTNSIEKVTLAFQNLRSMDWWKGLRSRLFEQ
jgi:hypothetical protein